MALINFIINLAALLLWLNWLALPFDPLLKNSTASLAGTLRKADPSPARKWKFLAGLALLLFLRAWIFWELSPALRWTPALHLGVINLSFRSDFFLRMALYSFLSFAFILGAFYLWLLLLSAANAKVSDADLLQKMVRVHLKWVERWPGFIKLLLPFFAGALLWLALHPLLVHLAIIPSTKSLGQLGKQALLEGVGIYLVWKYLVAGILLLSLAHSYVYLGNHPFWLFINGTARNLLYPIRWLPLRIGKVDFLPVAGIALVFLAAEMISRLPARYYNYLPF